MFDSGDGVWIINYGSFLFNWLIVNLKSISRFSLARFYHSCASISRISSPPLPYSCGPPPRSFLSLFKIVIYICDCLFSSVILIILSLPSFLCLSLSFSLSLVFPRFPQGFFACTCTCWREWGQRKCHRNNNATNSSTGVPDTVTGLQGQHLISAASVRASTNEGGTRSGDELVDHDELTQEMLTVRLRGERTHWCL